MTSRERVLSAINHKEADRIPKFDGFWEDTLIKYVEEGLQLPPQKTIEVEGQVKPINVPINDYFDYDIAQIFMDFSMRFPSRLVSDDGRLIVIEDQCGYTARKFKGKASSMQFLSYKCEEPEEWDEYKHRLSFDPNDKSRMDTEGYFMRTSPYLSWDGSKVLFDELRKQDKFLTAWGYGPYENSWRFHGMENCLMDLLAEPEMMAEMFNKTTDVICDTLQYMIEHDMKPDALWIAEDMGSTSTTLFSPKVYRELLFPCHKRLGDFCHKNGMYFMMHSCGKIESLLPDLIEAGLDVIQALQVTTGMDVVELKKKYGDKITFMGNIGEQKFAAGKESIEKEIRYKIGGAKKDGGYIYHSDHSIPPEVDLDTYRYAIKLVDEVGTYNK